MQTTKNSNQLQVELDSPLIKNTTSTEQIKLKEITQRPSIDETEKQKIEEMNSKEYLMEHYVQDEQIIKEYKELFAPIKKRLKYTFYFNVAVCSFSLMYAKNLGFYLTKYFPNMTKSLLNLVLFSSVHAIGFSAILIGGNLAILGVNPKKFLAKYREIDQKIMSNDPYKDLTLQGFMEGVSEGFNKKADNNNGNNNNSDSGKNSISNKNNEIFHLNEEENKI